MSPSAWFQWGTRTRTSLEPVLAPLLTSCSLSASFYVCQCFTETWCRAFTHQQMLLVSMKTRRVLKVHDREHDYSQHQLDANQAVTPGITQLSLYSHQWGHDNVFECFTMVGSCSRGSFSLFMLLNGGGATRYQHRPTCKLLHVCRVLSWNRTTTITDARLLQDVWPFLVCISHHGPS